MLQKSLRDLALGFLSQYTSFTQLMASSPSAAMPLSSQR